LWEYSEGASTQSSSVVAAGIIYAPSSGIAALCPSASNASPTQLWHSKQINPAMVSPFVLGDRIYSLNNAGVLSSAEIKTGDVKWKLRLTGPFSGSPVGAGTRVLLVNEKGLVQVVDSTAPQGAVAGQLQLPLNTGAKEVILCTPAISGRHVYVRADSALWRLGE
jgi:outer membrane protein assembly factor BamB